jgi:hypothetical protein
MAPKSLDTTHQSRRPEGGMAGAFAGCSSLSIDQNYMDVTMDRGGNARDLSSNAIAGRGNGWSNNGNGLGPQKGQVLMSLRHPECASGNVPRLGRYDARAQPRSVPWFFWGPLTHAGLLPHTFRVTCLTSKWAAVRERK